MGRKTKGKARAKQSKNTRSPGNLTPADDASLASDSDDGVDVTVDVDSSVCDALELLTEKRATTRMSALKTLLKLLQTHYLEEFVGSRRDTLATYLMACIKKGASNEVTAACNVLNAVTLTLGAEAEAVCSEVSPLLSVIARDPKKAEGARCAAVQALSVLTFVGSGSPEETAQTLEVFRSLYKGTKVKGDKGADLITDATQAWTLLASVLSDAELSAAMNTHVPEFVKLLQTDSVNVRLAAGEAIALVYSAHLERTQNRAREEKKVHLNVDLSALADTLHQLSTDGSKRQARKDRRVQKAGFREIMRTIDDGEQPEDSLSIGLDRHTFQGWRQTRQLDTVRTVLGTGLQTHLVENDLLKQIFGLQVTSTAAISAAERREMRADAVRESKTRARERNDRDRRSRAMKTAHVLADE